MTSTRDRRGVVAVGDSTSRGGFHVRQGVRAPHTDVDGLTSSARLDVIRDEYDIRSSMSPSSDGFESARERPDTPSVMVVDSEGDVVSDTDTDEDEDSGGASSSESTTGDRSGSSAGDRDDDKRGDGGAENATNEDAELNNRNLVHFLQTLQCAAHEQLACAAVPSRMRAAADLRPFQLQALQWMLQREQRVSSSSSSSSQTPTTRHGPARGVEAWTATRAGAHAAIETSGGIGSYAEGDGDDLIFGDTSELTAHSSWSAHGVASSPWPRPHAMLHSSDMNTVRGGILADYMGLGKTRTMIALCESTRGPHVDCVTGSQVYSHATLIVCPTALLAQWANEIRSCVQPAPRILLYHGSRKRHLSLFDVAQKFDYVLTTYQTLRHEPDIRAPSPGKLYMIQWQRVVLDEAHYIRNARTQQSRACLRLSGTYRWAVTATPVQNSVNDLFVLLRFLQVPHFSSYQWWNREIVHYLNVNPQHPRPLTALRILFSALLLRRTPATRVNGSPIVHLPMKSVVTRRIRLSGGQQQFYENVQRMAARKLTVLQQQRRGDTTTALGRDEAVSGGRQRDRFPCRLPRRRPPRAPLRPRWRCWYDVDRPVCIRTLWLRRCAGWL